MAPCIAVRNIAATEIQQAICGALNIMFEMLTKRPLMDLAVDHCAINRKVSVKRPRVGNALSACYRTFDGIVACQTHRANVFRSIFECPIFENNA